MEVVTPAHEPLAPHSLKLDYFQVQLLNRGLTLLDLKICLNTGIPTQKFDIYNLITGMLNY